MKFLEEGHFIYLFIRSFGYCNYDSRHKSYVPVMSQKLAGLRQLPQTQLYMCKAEVMLLICYDLAAWFIQLLNAFLQEKTVACDDLPAEQSGHPVSLTFLYYSYIAKTKIFISQKSMTELLYGSVSTGVSAVVFRVVKTLF